MTKKPDTTTIIAATVATAAAGLAAYMFFRTYKSMKELEELHLDFGNDDALLSTFDIRNRMRDYK